MHHRKLVLAGLLGLAATLSAATVELNLPHRELALANGRTLAGATLKSYNTVTDMVSVAVGREILAVRFEELPAAVRAQVRERVPYTDEEIAAERRQAREATASRAKRAEDRQERRERAQEREAGEARRESRREAVEAKEKTEARAERTLEQVAAAAHAAVRRKFRYEENVHSGSAYVLSDEYELREPEEVPGWTGRYRLTGRAYVREYDSRGGFNTRVRDLEVLVQTRDKGAPEVIDVLLK